jgi:ribose transport system permease protein
MDEVKAKNEKTKISIGYLLKKYNLLILLFLFIIVSTMISPNFLKIRNILNILRSASFGGILAIGMTFVILIGGIDLSVGYTANFAGMVCAFLLVKGVPVLLAIVIAIAAGAVLGLLSGTVINYFRIPPFIATLAVMLVAQGLSLFVTNGDVVNNLPKSFTQFGSMKVLGSFPMLALIWIVLTVISALLLKYASFGRRLYAMGGNPESAYLSGINIKKYSIITYVISACLAAFAGILLCSYLTVGQPTAIISGETDAIASTVIGGTSMLGGIGGVVGTFGGVILLQLITNIFNLIGIPPFFQYVFKGLIIIMALILNNFVTGSKKS